MSHDLSLLTTDDFDDVFDDDMLQDDDDLDMLDDIDDIDPDELPDDDFEEEEEEPPPKRRAPAKRSRARAAKPKKEPKIVDWATAISDATPDTTRTYSIEDSYKPGEFLKHPKFGLGLVREIRSKTKVEVLFEEGPKRLVCNLGA